MLKKSSGRSDLVEPHGQISNIRAQESRIQDADEDHLAMPPFGRADSEWADVSAFYRRKQTEQRSLYSEGEESCLQSLGLFAVVS